jgi:hypothetical protein
MQLMTATDDSPRMLRLASQFLLDAAQLMEAETVHGQLMPAVPGPTVDEAPTAAEAFAKVPEGTGRDKGVDDAPFEAPPVIPAPVVIPPPPPVTSPAVSLGPVDKDGLPHDPRIHSATPTMTTSGTWRRRRNLDHATLVAVEAELRARPTVSLPPAPVIPPPPPVVAAPNAPAATVMVPPPPPVAAGVSEGSAAGVIDPFRQLMRRIENQTDAGGRFAPEVVKPFHAEFGATGWADYVGKCRAQIPALMLRLDQVPA